MRTPLQRIRIGAISLATVLGLSVIGYRLIGDYSWLEATWMVVVTISTVGYSENTDSSAAIQVLTILLILLGVTAAAYTCGGFIQMLLEGEVERVMGRRKMTRELSQLSQHVIICRFSRLGQDLAIELQHTEVPFVIVGLDLAKVSLARERDMLATGR